MTNKDLEVFVETASKLAVEIQTLRTERTRWIGLLEDKLDVLKGVPCKEALKAKPTAPKAKPTAKATAPKVVAPKSKPKPTPPKAGPKTKGTQIVRKDGRTFTFTGKVVRARKLQGQYLGRLRHVERTSDRLRIQKIAKTQGVPAAIKALNVLTKG